MLKKSTLKIGVSSFVLTAFMITNISAYATDFVSVDSGTVIINANIVDTATGGISYDKAVIIKDGYITNIVDSTTVKITGNAKTVNAENKFVVPGYNDMHVHAIVGESGFASIEASSNENLDAQNQQMNWNLFIANGVTGVRQMSGSSNSGIQKKIINNQSNSGNIIAPEILQTSGSLFLGQFKDNQGAVDFVKDHKKNDLDFIKILGGSREKIFAALKQAKDQGTYVAGHIPSTLTAAEASDGGFHTLEHLGSGFTIGFDCAAAAPAIREKMANAAPSEFKITPEVIFAPTLFSIKATEPAMKAVMATYQDDKCRKLAQKFIKNNTWHVPTLIRMHTVLKWTDPSFTQDKNLKYVPEADRKLWSQIEKKFDKILSKEIKQTLSDFNDFNFSLAKMINEENVRIMTGSDYGGIWLIPGFSLHQEFNDLSSAGFTPLEILQASTSSVAEFLERDDMGSVSIGKQADLLLLDANPIESVENLHKISGVMVNGRFHNKQDIAELLNEVENSYK